MTIPWMLEEIREQPAVLARVVLETGPRLRSLAASRSMSRVHLVGCGDTFFAAQSASWLARTIWRREAFAWRSMEMRWLAPSLGEDDLVVCASVSGRTRRTIEAAWLARSRGARVVGLCDNPGSALSEPCESTVLLGTSPPETLARGVYAGYEHQVPQTKTYTALLAAQLLLLAPPPEIGEELLAVPASIEHLLPELESVVDRLPSLLFEGRREVALLGSGPWLPMARYGAAKWIEFAIPALSQCLEEYNHQQMFVADRRTLAIVLAPDREARERAEELPAAWEALGVACLVVTGGETRSGREVRLEGAERVRLVLPSLSLLESTFAVATLLQLLALRGALECGRSVDEWVGGRRTDLIQEASQATIRSGRIWNRLPGTLEKQAEA